MRKIYKAVKRLIALALATAVLAPMLPAETILAANVVLNYSYDVTRYIYGTNRTISRSVKWDLTVCYNDNSNLFAYATATGTGTTVSINQTVSGNGYVQMRWISFAGDSFVEDGITYYCPPYYEYEHYGSNSGIGGVVQSTRKTFYYYPMTDVSINIKNVDGTAYTGDLTITDSEHLNYEYYKSSGYGWYVNSYNTFTTSYSASNGVVNAWISSAVPINVRQYTAFNNYNEYIDTTLSTISSTMTVNTKKTQNTFTITAGDSVTGGGIAGITYSTVDPWGVTITATTDSTGKAVFTLPYNGNGTYTFQEVSIPKGYKKSGQGFDMTCTTATTNSVKYHGGTASKSLSYVYYPELDVSSLSIILTDSETSAPINGAMFNVQQGSTVVKIVVTDSSGTANISSIDNGTYYVYQKSSAQYYNFSTAATSVTISSADKVLELQNTKKKGTLKIKITDTGGNAISDAKFLLYGNNASKTVTSDSTGYITQTSQSYGTYQLTEYSIPSGYQPKNQTINLVLDDSTTGVEFVYTYAKVQDTTPPTISFGTLPADNSVTSYTQTLTLTDSGSGVKELYIDGVVVKTVTTEGMASATYDHVITANKTYTYKLTDYANNVYTTAQTVRCIINSPVQLSDPALSNYKSTVAYDGKTAYIVNSAYSYSTIRFNLTDADAADTWSYKIDVKDESGSTVYSAAKAVTAPGTITDRILYQNSTTGAAFADGVYRAIITVYDKYGSASDELQIIVKRAAPPKPTITAADGEVTITYPSDWLEEYASKQYTYRDTTQDYTGAFPITARGTVTATYMDLAGNKSTALLSVSSGVGSAGGSGGTGGSVSEPPISSNSSGNFQVEETRNLYLYYINTRRNGSDPDVTNAILQLVID